MRSKYPEIGVCGLSCRLCPNYVMKTKSRCPGCKTKWRLGAACAVLRCAAKRNLEFCGECEESKTCAKWKKHRETGKKYDSFKCYQKLEADIAFMQKHGLDEFRKTQKVRERLLRKMLDGFDEGRSKSYYCLAATVLEADEIDEALKEVRKGSKGMDIKKKAELLHSILDRIAREKKYCLELRKKG